MGFAKGSLYTIYIINKGSGYKKNSIRHQYIKRINKSCSDLLFLLNPILEANDYRFMRKLEMPSMSTDDQFNIPQLIMHLSALEKGSKTLMQDKGFSIDIEYKRKDKLDYIVRELYGIFTQGTGKTLKVTKSLDHDDGEQATYTGDFFIFLRGFYKAIDFDIKDSTIADHITDYT